MAALMREAYAWVWYELCVALAARSGSVATYAGHSARGAYLYSVLEDDRTRRSHIVYHFAPQRRFSCTCQPNEGRHLPCAHVGAVVLYLQALSPSAQQSF